MNKGTAITVMEAENGFVVRPAYRDQCVVTEENFLVFQSMMELLQFLESHFEYRCNNISADLP